jgi:hypothetical protein
MNERSDFDRVLTHWFDDGPSTMPDRVVDVVAGRISGERQRRAWRLDWRHPMNPYLKAVVGLAAALAVAVAGWSLLPKSPDGASRATPTPTLLATPSATQDARPSPTLNVNGECGLPLSSCRGEIEAGTYTSRVFEPALTFTLPDGTRWFNTFDGPMGYGLVPWDAANQAAARSGDPFHTTIELQRDLAVTRADCEELPEPGVGRTAMEMVNALYRRPGLIATGPQPVQLGALAGFTIDLQIDPEWTDGCPQGPGPSVPILVDPRAAPGTGLHWGVIPDERFRLIVLDSGERGDTVLISIWSDTANGWESYLADAMTVVESSSFAE